MISDVDKFDQQPCSIGGSNLSQLAAAERQAGILTALWRWHHLGVTHFDGGKKNGLIWGSINGATPKWMV